MHRERIEIEEMALKVNDEVAMRNRHRFSSDGVLVVNIMGAPGSGKTTLLEALIPKLDRTLAVIEGDVAGDADAERIRRLGITTHQINTYGSCHLLAKQVEEAYERLLKESGSAPSLVFIENVGNLVCPAEFDLGEALRIVVYSATEGEEKPRKYPHMFMRSHCVVLNKADIAEAAGCDIEALRKSVFSVNPAAALFVTSAKLDDGVGELADWLEERVKLISG